MIKLQTIGKAFVSALLAFLICIGWAVGGAAITQTFGEAARALWMFGTIFVILVLLFYMVYREDL